ncbi:MAG: NAD(P)/FAD-dependent oxidoreductase [Candidatus Rehaiarchaeum fermentans]|nr:NAD(P)/FAD-dependent oxidoreductase [Candidatus Rehaiarchaeum fermentans]
MEEYELVIVGGGPIGLYAALIAKLYNLSFILLESTNSFGGQVISLYPTKPVDDSPGLVNAEGKDLIDNLLKQLEKQNAIQNLRLNSKVIDIINNNDKFLVKLENGNVISTKAILLSIGFGEVVPKTLNVPGEKEFLDKGVYYYVKSREDFKGKRVAVIGGGDSAFDWALDIIDYANEIYIIQHNDKLKAAPLSIEKFKQKNGKILLNKNVISINGKDRVESITIQDVVSNSKEDLQIDSVIIAIGNLIHREQFPSINLEKNQYGFIIDKDCQTSVKNIYAAGDCSAYDGSRFLSVGFGQAALAVEMIARSLRPAGLAPLH